MGETSLFSGQPTVFLNGNMAVEYVSLNESNISEWKNKIYRFAANLDVGQRCNAAAVSKQRWSLTYPSINALQEIVNRGEMLIVAHDGEEIVGYMICVDDTNGKYGGCHCKWIGVGGVPPGQMPGIYAAMGDFAVSRYGWLWGRVTNDLMKGQMMEHIFDCDADDLGPGIVTYKKP